MRSDVECWFLTNSNGYPQPHTNSRLGWAFSLCKYVIYRVFSPLNQEHKTHQTVRSHSSPCTAILEPSRPPTSAEPKRAPDSPHVRRGGSHVECTQYRHLAAVAVASKTQTSAKKRLLSAAERFFSPLFPSPWDRATARANEWTDSNLQKKKKQPYGNHRSITNYALYEY